MFSVNASTGALTARGSPASTGASPSGVAFSPTGRLLATSNNGGHTLSLFAVNNQTARPDAGERLAAVGGTRKLSRRGRLQPHRPARRPPVQRRDLGVRAGAAQRADHLALDAEAFARGASVRDAIRLRREHVRAWPGVVYRFERCTAARVGTSQPRRSVPTPTRSPRVVGTARAPSRDCTISSPMRRPSGSPPHSGKTYRLRARVATRFACHEGCRRTGPDHVRGLQWRRVTAGASRHLPLWALPLHRHRDQSRHPDRAPQHHLPRRGAAVGGDLISAGRQALRARRTGAGRLPLPRWSAADRGSSPVTGP